jgi:hypothetical protein
MAGSPIVPSFVTAEGSFEVNDKDVGVTACLVYLSLHGP